jgi:hypothetical protein
MPVELQKQTKEIDGVTYEVTPLPFGVGQKALMRFLRIAAPLLAAATEESKNQMALGAAVMKAIPAVISEADLDYFSEQFGNYSRYAHDGKMVPLVKVNQETHFAGKYYEFFQWLVFCLEVNFSGFFAGIMRGGSGAVLPEILKTA